MSGWQMSSAGNLPGGICPGVASVLLVNILVWQMSRPHLTMQVTYVRVESVLKFDIIHIYGIFPTHINNKWLSYTNRIYVYTGIARIHILQG